MSPARNKREMHGGDTAEVSEVLRGYTVGVTAEYRSAEQVALLEGRGAECLLGSTAQLQPLACEASIGDAIRLVIQRPPSAFVALTSLAIRGLFEVAGVLGLSGQLHGALSSTRVFVRGPEAHGAVIAVELSAEWGARTESVVDVGEHLCSTLPRGASVIVVGDAASGAPMVDVLAAAGFEARVVEVHRWKLPDDLGPAEALVRAVAERRVDAVSFMSAPAVDHFVAIAESIGLRRTVEVAFSEQVVPVCVGPVSAARVMAAELGEPVVPQQARLGPMVQRLTDVLVAQSTTFELAGHQVELRGRLLRIDGGDSRSLAARERSVLLALLDRPGVVRSKQHLLDTVWGAGEVGTHVVEVTVGRLRRRLGPAGAGVETVIRRGYRLRAA